MRSVLLSLLFALAACATPPDDGLAEVTIRATVPEHSGPVYLAGSLPELGPWRADGRRMEGEGRERVAVLRVPIGTTLEFKITQGSWDREGLGPSGTVMPNNRIDVDGDERVTVAIADWKHDVNEYVADPAGAGVIGRLIYWRDVRSDLLEHPRHVEIYLPPQYDESSAARFPVIYAHDGQNLFDPRIANTGVDWGVDEAMQSLVAEGVIEPAIVVGIWSTSARRFEYAPAGVLALMSDDMKQAAAEEFPEGLRAGDAYLRFIVEELKPRIDTEFRTRPSRDSTFLMGSSMGALISVYGMAEYPAVFGGAAGLSMHWPVGVSDHNFIDQQERWRPAITAAFSAYFRSKRLDPATHLLWVDHGTGFLDHLYTPYQREMLPVLHDLGYVDGATLEARVYPGANHNETAWRERLREPLTFLLRRRGAAH
jgi:enterochelin esterase-like enzyme